MTLQELGGGRTGRAWSSLVVSLQTREAFIAGSTAQDLRQGCGLLDERLAH
jgi:hypothetical protein